VSEIRHSLPVDGLIQLLRSKCGLLCS